MERPAPPAPEASPVDDFSQCHAGIVGQLQVLDELSALLEPAARARRIAADTTKFFREVVYEHHQEEERELFPAVIASATDGTEREKVERIVAALTAEHRSVEAEWERLEPKLKAVAKGRPTSRMRATRRRSSCRWRSRSSAATATTWLRSAWRCTCAIRCRG